MGPDYALETRPRCRPSVCIDGALEGVVVVTFVVFFLDLVVLDGHDGGVTICEKSPLQGS